MLPTLIGGGDAFKWMLVDAAFGERGEVLAEERGDLVEEVDERVEDLIAARFGGSRRKYIVRALVQVET